MLFHKHLVSLPVTLPLDRAPRRRQQLSNLWQKLEAVVVLAFYCIFALWECTLKHSLHIVIKRVDGALRVRIETDCRKIKADVHFCSHQNWLA